MELTDLRRWHWIVLGALLGLIIGYALNAVGTDALETGAEAHKTSQTSFENDLLSPPKMLDGVPHILIKNMVVYPDGPTLDLVQMTQLVNLDPDVGDRSVKWAHQKSFYDAPRPYSPLFGAPRSEVWVKPGFAAEGYMGDNNWRNADGGQSYRDPGTKGVRLFLDIGKGNYDLAMILDDSKQAADLTATFNDHPLDPFTVDQSNPNWVHTSIPLADFGADNARVLSLSRKDSPVHIQKIHILNPAYTVRDYLDSLRDQRLPDGSQKFPNANYRYAWWLVPKAVLWESVGGAVLVVGIIWPTVIGLLVGAGLGPPPREKRVSLRNLKATPAPVPVVKVATEEDLESLEALEDRLLKNLEADAEGQPTSAAAATAVAAGPAPVQVLNAKPAEASPAPAKPKAEGPKSFKGEYYPVARKAGSDDPPKDAD
jgi:hypothetical protein